MAILLENSSNNILRTKFYLYKILLIEFYLLHYLSLSIAKFFSFSNLMIKHIKYVEGEYEK